MSWVWIVRGYGGSLQKIGLWGRSVQEWYQGCWIKDKRRGVCKCVKTFWSNSKLNPTCWKELLLAMIHGSSSTIHSPNCRALNGRTHCHQDPKAWGCSSPKPRWCWSLFLISMELSMQNYCQKAKLLISMSTKTCSDTWCTQWGRKEENCGKRGHGCFIMTILQLIMPWEFESFLPKITLLYWSNHPTRQIWPLVTFCFPNSRKSLKELVFKILNRVATSWKSPGKSLIFLAVLESLWILFKSPGKYLQSFSVIHQERIWKIFLKM